MYLYMYSFKHESVQEEWFGARNSWRNSKSGFYSTSIVGPFTIPHQIFDILSIFRLVYDVSQGSVSGLHGSFYSVSSVSVHNSPCGARMVGSLIRLLQPLYIFLIHFPPIRIKDAIHRSVGTVAAKMLSIASFS
jgi:hypothetical protein